MAGDWIKMRTNLWDDPRVMRLCDETDQPEAMIIGGLYWLWSAADEHSEDGIMSGLTIRGINRKTGITGFAEALCAIGWLADHPDGVRIINFADHNGSSAKKRCQTAKRVGSYRSANGDVTLDEDVCNATSVTPALAREDVDRDISTTSLTPVSDKFEIYDDWQPSQHFPTDMLRAGIPESFLNITALAEFIGFWKTRDSPARNTQAQWDHKFLQALISTKNKAGVSHANSSSGSRKLTSHDRVMLANSAAAAGR